MPTDDESIGFKNIWYPEGFNNAIDFKIDADIMLKVLSASYFIATKLEAFKGRGNGDGRTSPDFEDLVFVLENRQKIWTELRSTSGELRQYFFDEFKKLLENPYLLEWINCHVEPGSPPAGYLIKQEMEQFVMEHSVSEKT